MKVDTEKIVALAEGLAEDELVELVDVEIATEGPRWFIRVFIDREGGVRLGDCVSFSRKFSAILDVEDPVEGSRNFRGVLRGSDEEGIDLERGGRTFRLPYRLMRKANLEIPQEELFGKGTRRR